MGTTRRPTPVKLIIGFIFGQYECFVSAKGILEKNFGKIDFESEILPFWHTDYYKKEFGGDLKRIFISFRRLINPCTLPKIKIFTNKLERRLSKAGNRRINIDPGYLNLSKVVLATTKNYAHRIYLNNGVFAEVALFYQNGTFNAWGWTYPDYKSEAYIRIFNQARKIYAEQVD